MLSILADLQLIRETTSESLPSCMAMYGPDVVETLATASSIGDILSETDACSPLFDESATEYLQWINLNCERRTRALMCSVLGNYNL